MRLNDVAFGVAMRLKGSDERKIMRAAERLAEFLPARADKAAWIEAFRRIAG